MRNSDQPENDCRRFADERRANFTTQGPTSRYVVIGDFPPEMSAEKLKAKFAEHDIHVDIEHECCTSS
jgi:hypothetical protein